LELSCPADEDSLFELELVDSGSGSSSAALADWLATMAAYCFEQEGLQLNRLLDRIRSSYEKQLKPRAASAAAATGSSASASSASAAAASAQPAAAAASSMDMDEDWGADDEDAEFGDGGDDGDGWGEFKEEAPDADLEDTAWAAQKALKKRLIAKAEEFAAKHAHAAKVQGSAKNIKSIFSSDAAITMLTNDVMSYMSADPSSGVTVRPVDEDVFVWNVRLSGFPADSEIACTLKQLRELYNYDYVELEMKFMPDLFPFFPPTVRLVRPRLQNYMIGRLVCMPEIQLANWNPTRTVKDILGCIRRVLEAHGAVDMSDPEVNDPDSELPPYTALEFDLLRLTMLTDIAPRVVSTMGDPESIKLIVPKQKKQKADEAGKDESGSAAYAAAGGQSSRGFKKGTGYGGGSSEKGWDVEAWRAAQLKKDSEVCEIAHSLSIELDKGSVPPSLAVVLEQSSLVPFLRRYLGNDSISDMEAHPAIHHDVFDIATNMSKHPTLLRLFEPLPGDSAPSLAQLLGELRKSASIANKFEKFAKGASVATATDSSDDATAHVSKRRGVTGAPTVDHHAKTITAHILDTCDVVDGKLAIYRSQRAAETMEIDSNTPAAASAAAFAASSSKAAASSSASAAAASSSSAAAAASSSSSAVPDYVAIQSPLRFGEVENFKSHHYTKAHGATSAALSRQWVKRLGTEYSDLSRSLPINEGSSVFLRYKEDAMAFCQFLIAAPDDTPYGYGCFLFDAFFPNTYPQTPPMVNLQTTGGGSVRFNPNLYNCGKVCLSLLGTWSGAAGENWSASTSTFLQVLVSIQSLILVPEPYFNEPGYQSSLGTAQGKAQSEQYNRVIEVATVRYAMIDMMKNPPDWAKEIVANHFCLHRLHILEQCRDWATRNPSVAALLPQLEEELNKQKLADGSRPALPVKQKKAADGESAAAAAAAATPASRRTRSKSKGGEPTEE